MQADHQAQVAFHLTGRPAGSLDSLAKLKLRPALFSSFRELGKLRYDFPLVLARDASGAQSIQSLSALVDGALAQAAPAGIDGERVRKQVLRLEEEIRSILAGGGSGSLSDLWNKASIRLPSHRAETPDLGLKRVQAALKVDGELLECGADTAARLFTHAWRAVQEEKASRFRDRVARLVLKLSDILKADFAASEGGRSAQHLRAAVGNTHQDAFDFAALSRMLNSVPAAPRLSESRRRRIQGLITVLEAQRFYPAPAARGSKASRSKGHTFVFESCAEAGKAFRERLPEQAELAKALAAAELEVNGEYMETKHDSYFAGFGATALDAKDHAQFPAYLVFLKTGAQATDYASLLELLSAGVPVKIVLQFDDLVEDSAIPGQPVLSLRSKQLADMAIGLGTVFVLQSSASNLYQCHDELARGLNFAGPALFSVYSGLTGAAGGVAPYLAAAAAMECRAFPAFAYDPSAGPDWASRFHIERNPQPDRDWPAQSFAYEDQDHQRVAEELDFTLVDFFACDPRYAGDFARLPRENWNGSMMTVRESLAQTDEGLPEKVPYLLMVDSSDVLQKVIVGERLIREARRLGDVWRSLQELGGIRNSHAERLLEREKRSWEEQKQRELESLKRAPAPAPVAVAPVAAAPVVQTQAAAPAAAPAAAAPAAAIAAEPAEEKRSDEAYIETPRCTTCEECMQINKQMFVYDGNKQAYIADLKAGTYRQMVEAAESCQVSIIHPGKPWDPSEAGLEELIARAEPFQ